MNPDQMPTEAGLKRFKNVVSHLGAVDMRPREAPEGLPPTDARASEATRRIAVYAKDKSIRPV